MTREQMLGIPLLVKLCSDKAAYEVRMKNQTVFNMEKAKELLEAEHNHKIIVYTPHMIILRSGTAEATFSRDGRMLIKKVSNETEATQVAHKIFQTALSAASKP
jgi:hypothetical protein